MSRFSVSVISGIVLAAALAPADAAPPEPLEILAPATSPAPDPRFRSLLDRLPLAFEVNKGQAPAGWDLLVRCRGYHAFVASTGIIFSFDGARLSMSLDDAVACEPTTRGRELPGRANYFLGNDPEKWVTEIPLLRGASYREVTPGTTWSVAGDGRDLEFAFDLAPGVVGPRLRFDGARGVRVADDGSLRLAMPHGEAWISRPVAWQDVPGARLDAAARFVGEKDGAIRIDVTPRDPSRPVHVDPTVSYASYFGGNNGEPSGKIAVDRASSSLILAGTTTSTDLPASSGAYDTTRNGSMPNVHTDVFVAKLDSTGTGLVFLSYLGGSLPDELRGMAVDAQGNVIVGGEMAGTDFPATSNPLGTQQAGGGYPGYLAKLSPTGSSLVWSAYTGPRYPSCLCLASGGDPFVGIDGLNVWRVAANGSSIVWNNEILNAGSNFAECYAIASDASDNVFIAGRTNATNFPTTVGAYSRTASAGFVVKLASSSPVVWASYFPAFIYGLAVDSSGRTCITGNPQSSFPITAGALQSTSQGQTDAFFTRFSADGTSLVYSTYIGGTGDDVGSVLTADGSGNCFVGGNTRSTNFPTYTGVQTYGGGVDGFVVMFEASNLFSWSTFLGGSNDDVVIGLVADPFGSVAIAGVTTSTNFPTAGVPYQASGGGQGDLFAARIRSGAGTAPAVSITTSALPVWTAGAAFSRQLASSGGTLPVSWTVAGGRLPPGFALSSGGVLSGTFSAAGTWKFAVRVADSAGQAFDRVLAVTANPAPSISTSTLPATTELIAYDSAVSASAGTGSYVFAQAGGTVPPGSVFGADGHLTGTPTTSGDFSFTARLTDEAGAVATQSVSIRVNAYPSITAEILPPCTENVPYPHTFTASGGTGGLTWSLAAGSAPTGAGFSPSTAGISGALLSAGTYDFTLRVRDALGAEADRAFSVPVNPLPQVLTTSLPPAASGRSYAGPLQASGGTGTLTWNLASGVLPAGVSFARATGRLIGTPSVAGRFPAVYTVTDACGVAAAQAIDLDVASALDLAKKKLVETFDLAPGGVRVLRYLELTAGAVVGIQVSGGASRDAAAEIVLTDHARNRVDLSALTRETAKSTTVKGWAVPETSRYFLSVVPGAGVTGKMKVTVTIAPPSKWTAGATVGPAATSEFRFSAMPGALLSIVAKATKGSAALPKIVSILDGAGNDLLAGETVIEKGKAASLKSRTPLAGGDYRVVFGTRDATAGAIAWTVAIKAPKSYTFALTDLAEGE